MAEIESNTVFLEKELEWFADYAVKRVAGYFDGGGSRTEAGDLPQPVPAGEFSGAYASFIEENGLSVEDRVCLMLCFAPLLRPQILDCFNIKNSDTGRRFVEFGCREFQEGRILKPTLETLLFLLAGTGISGKLRYASHFLENKFFSLHCISRETSGYGSDWSSYILSPSDEIVDNLIFGRPFRPKFSADFPATRMESDRDWDELVLDPNTRSQVEEIKLWVEYGGRVRKEWGLEKTLKPGYRALFYGPPGSGKTFTASLLGRATGKEVYRIDLSAVVSKYIGETEKNLGKVFSMAEDKEWILFFDEADSLFGKRTGIKDSHDRYANQEVSYLLQRIEDYPGLVVLSTNQKLNIDDAFARRFQSVIRFPMPNAEQRKAIWTSSFSPETAFEASIDWEQISRKYELTGGAIINVVQYASVMSMSRGEAVIRLNDILQGIRREYTKEGKMTEGVR